MADGKVIVDGTEISIEDLSDKCKYFNAQVSSLTMQIEEQQFKLAQLTAAKEVFENTFLKALQDESEE